MHIRNLALALLALSGCDCGEGIVTRPPPCDGETFGYLRWTLDGLPGELCSALSIAAPTGSPPTQVIQIGADDGCMLPSGYNTAGLSLYNVPLEAGRAGTLVGGDVRGTRTFPSQIGVDHEGVHAEVYLGLDLPGGRECGNGEDDARYSIGGRYRVIQGGGPGDTVEVEARDVEFLPAPDGRQFRFDWMYWRAVVRDVHDPPVPSAPRDSGL